MRCSMSQPLSPVRQARDQRMRCRHESRIWLRSYGGYSTPAPCAAACPAAPLPLGEAAADDARLSPLLLAWYSPSSEATAASGRMPASGGFSNLPGCIPFLCRLCMCLVRSLLDYKTKGRDVAFRTSQQRFAPLLLLLNAHFTGKLPLGRL